GTAALLPVLATCALLAGGRGSSSWGATRLLSLKPMRSLGDISYSLYLWHWPVLVLGPELLGLSPGPWERALLVAIAVLLSTISYHVVENPLRKPRRPGRGHSTGLLLWPASLTAVSAIVLMAWPAA